MILDTRVGVSPGDAPMTLYALRQPLKAAWYWTIALVDGAALLVALAVSTER